MSRKISTGKSVIDVRRKDALSVEAPDAWTPGTDRRERGAAPWSMRDSPKDDIRASRKRRDGIR